MESRVWYEIMMWCCREVPASSLATAAVWLHAYQNILFTQAFWQALLWPWIILCSPLPPSRHNHTCLILSNLSFILANQLLCCALFHHLHSCDSIIFSLAPFPTPLLWPHIPSFCPSLSLSAFLCHGIRVNLDPSKRQGSNKSVSGCTLPQGSKTVSKFPCRASFLSTSSAPSLCLVMQETALVHERLPNFLFLSVYELLLVCMTF